MILSYLLGIAWAMIDGRLAAQGAPSILTMTPRRVLNMVYFMAIENMTEEDREDFESKLHLSMLDLQVQAAEAKKRERQERLALAAEFGEVG